MTALEIWDYDQEKFIINPNNPDGELSAIYVGTELELDMEVDIIMWATVSGVETSKIIEWDLTEEEEERIDYAIDVIQRSKIHLYDRPNYSISMLEKIVMKHQRMGEDVYTLGIDYILITGALAKEAKESYQMNNLRGDEIFLYISKSFKERLANALNIYVSSSTQLNRGKNDKNADKDESMIRGSFALCDKVDCGSIIMPIENYEVDLISEILKKHGGWGIKKPSHVEHVFKNRGGKLVKIRIFRLLNLGNMEMEDMFCTDWDYKLIDVEKLVAEPYERDELDEVEEDIIY